MPNYKKLWNELRLSIMEYNNRYVDAQSNNKSPIRYKPSIACEDLIVKMEQLESEE